MRTPSLIVLLVAVAVVGATTRKTRNCVSSNISNCGDQPHAQERASHSLIAQELASRQYRNADYSGGSDSDNKTALVAPSDSDQPEAAAPPKKEKTTRDLPIFPNDDAT